MTIIGLAVVFVAFVLGVVGVLANGGSTHALTDNFAVFGYHVTGSTGVLFLYGIVVGALGAAGLSTVLLATRRTARRGVEARRELAFYKPAPVSRSGRDQSTWQQRIRTRDDALAQPDPVITPTRREPAAQPENSSPRPQFLRRSAGHDATAAPIPHGDRTGDRK
ncbi:MULTISPECIES: hypothetical protein [Nocardia]|uniref:hypothetical protein n=1 Tax=Nocardia TaxID=1817 RepID=UPI00083754B9|nr:MULTISPECIES: hypothetical protein [Nocardia]UFS95303.1 hypothetical protein LPY97_32200 [Nocardia huaxiensis]